MAMSSITGGDAVGGAPDLLALTVSSSTARITTPQAAGHSLHGSKGTDISLRAVSNRMQEWIYLKYHRKQHFHQTLCEASQHQEKGTGLAGQGLTGCFGHSPNKPWVKILQRLLEGQGRGQQTRMGVECLGRAACLPAPGW